MMKAGEEGSHAVYPLASKVLRMPPLGKLEASGLLLCQQLAGETLDDATVRSVHIIDK